MSVPHYDDYEDGGLLHGLLSCLATYAALGLLWLGARLLGVL